jgi:fatty acid synthase subunit beta
VPPKRNSHLASLDSLRSNPRQWLSELFDHYPIAKTELLTTEDIDFFINLCRRGGLKPVNYVPVIDSDLEFWFKRDSLWQSENLELVHEQDVGM